MTKEAYTNAATNIQYSHNAFGQLTTLSRPHGQGDVTYLYDDMAQLTKVDSGSGDAAYEHDDELRVTKTAYDNYTDASYYYDAGGRLTKLINNFDTASYTQTYDYDQAGNRTKTTMSGSSSGSITYSYDDVFQLTRETRSGTSNNYDHQYWFDAAGNRTKQVKAGATTTFLYNNVNQLTKSTATATWTYSYDDNGNLTKKYKDANNLTAYYWDSRNLLTKVTVTTGGSSTDHTFAYDALGRRESMTSGGTTTDYMYEGLKVLVEKTNAVTKTYTNGPQAVGGIVSRNDGTNTTYYHYDAIGNVLLTSDGDGYVDAEFVQDAYGNVIAGAASGYHLTTKEYFPAFGLYYFNARWYDPENGRWISKEPLRTDGPNLYHYNFNNPINAFDVDGMQSIYGPLPPGPGRYTPPLPQLPQTPLPPGVPPGRWWRRQQCCNRTNKTEYVAINPPGGFIPLPPGMCTNSNDDCDGMTCNGAYFSSRDRADCNPRTNSEEGWCPIDGPNAPDSPWDNNRTGLGRPPTPPAPGEPPVTVPGIPGDYPWYRR